MVIYRTSTTSAVLVTLDNKISSIASETAARKSKQLEYEKKLQANLKDVYDKQKEKSLGGGSSSRRAFNSIQDKDNMQMDVDEPLDGIKGKNRKCVQLFLPSLTYSNLIV